jgi:hypothetical protein
MHTAASFKPSERCSLTSQFRLDLMNAILSALDEDHQSLDAALKKLDPTDSAAALRKRDAELYYTLVRCFIEEPDISWPRISKVLKKYRNAKDIHGRALFTKAALDGWPRACEAFRTGLCSDKPGEPVFEPVRLHPKYGLTVWRRIRGENRVERIFRELHLQFGGFNHRAEIVHHQALAFGVAHNIHNSAGKWLPSRQHGDIALMCEVDALHHEAFTTSAYESWFVNGSFWPATDERHGLSPLVGSYAEKYNIEQGAPRISKDHSQFHLARLYGTTLPIAPVQDHLVNDILNTLNGFKCVSLARPPCT